MTIYPDSVVIEYYNGTAWDDISAYVVSDIRGFQGHTTTDPLDRVAGLGTLEFELNNVDELFTPMGGDSVRGLSTLTGFNRGAKIRVRVTYADHDRVMFFGRISGISSDDGTWGRRRVSVSCVDWMDIAAKYPTKSSTVLSQQMLGTAMPVLLDRVSVQPENRYIDDGIFTFPSVFDNTSEKTKAISEINKLTLSELGYTYILKDGSIVVEDILHRRGTIPLTTIPNIEEVYLLDEGTEILAGASTGTLLTASWDYEEPSLEFTAKKLTIKLNEDDLYNRLQTTCYPVKYDTSLVVIYSLGNPLALGASQTITFTGKYTDPDGGNPINATNQQTPVITTDYLANTLEAGTGTNISSDIAITATYYGDLVEYTLTNNNSSDGYITFLQARGFGIYRNNTLKTEVLDTTSINTYGDSMISLDQKYKKYPYAGEILGKTLINKYRNPKSRVTDAEFTANLNESHFMSFMYLDVGDKILINENRSNISEHYYVLSKKFNIALGGVITSTYTLLAEPSYLSGQLNPVTLRFNVTGTNSSMNAGYNSQVHNLRKKTVSIWVYPTGDTGTSKVFMTSDLVVYGIASVDLKAFFYQVTTGVVGTWTTPTNSVTLNAWNHIVFTHDTSVSHTTDPIIYINGVEQTLTETSTPTGQIPIDNFNATLFGNALGHVTPFYGYIKDPRVYNSILALSNVVELYNGGVQDYSIGTYGLMFQGFFVSADVGDATSLDGSLLVTPKFAIDNVFHTIGRGAGLGQIRIDAP